MENIDRFVTEVIDAKKWQNAIENMAICYVLVRTDVPDFRWGKTCAQTHHCGTQMTEDLIKKNFPDLNDLYDEWKSDAVAELALAEHMRDFLSITGQIDDFNYDDYAGIEKVAQLRAAAAAGKRTFGTVLTLAVTAADMRQSVSLAQLIGLHAGITHDPTYPMLYGDGEQTRVVTAPVDTCAYIFGRKSDCSAVLSKFELLSEKHIL